MPRTGFAWDLHKDGRTVVRGGYGRFYDQLFDNIPNTEDLFGITGNFSITLTPTGNPGVFPAFPAVLSGLPSGFGAAIGRTVTLDLGALDPAARKTPFSDQLTIGVAHELQANLALAVDYIYLRGHDLFRTVDLNGPSAFDTTTRATRTIAQADATRPYGSPSRVPGPYGIQEGGFKQIRAVVSEGNGWYSGLKLNLTKRSSNKHFYQFSYTLSRAENEQDDFGSAAQGSDPSTSAARGRRTTCRTLRGERDLRPPLHDLALGHRGAEVRADAGSSGGRRSQRRRVHDRPPRRARTQQLRLPRRRRRSTCRWRKRSRSAGRTRSRCAWTCSTCSTPSTSPPRTTPPRARRRAARQRRSCRRPACRTRASSISRRGTVSKKRDGVLAPALNGKCKRNQELIS